MANRSPKVGVVGLAGGWSSEALADAFAERTGFRLLVSMDELVVDLGRRRVMYRDQDLCELDGLVIKKVSETYGPAMLDQLELLRVVENAGVRVFSRPSSILRLIDRLACTVTLNAAGIPMPATVVTQDAAAAVATIRRFGGAVLKPLYSTKARGMVVLKGDEPDLESRVHAFRDSGNPVIYVQERLEIPDRDFGLVFIGGSYVGAYARIGAEGAWNTTIHSGGRYAPHEPSPEVIEMAHRAQAGFNLDFTSVDVVETERYGSQVFEVSAFGGFRGLKEGVGIDPASTYVDYVLGSLPP